MTGKKQPVTHPAAYFQHHFSSFGVCIDLFVFFDQIREYGAAVSSRCEASREA